MFKAIIGLLAGVLVAGALFAGPLSPLPTLAEQGDTETDPATGDGPISASGTIAEVLNQAADGITDTDIATYYEKLVDSYQLDETATGGTLPDIDNITRQAITLPLLEAGKTITDSEIAEFYRDFLASTGLTNATD